MGPESSPAPNHNLGGKNMTNRPMRRAKGAGSVRQRGKGSWQIRYDGPPDANGKITKLSEAVRGSRRDAEKVLRDRLGVVEDGSYVAKNKETVAGFMSRWLDTYAATNTRPSTQCGYEGKTRQYIAPYLGALPLQNLQPANIQKMYADMLGRGLSSQTVRLTHVILKEALSHAVTWGLLNRNPAEAATSPKPEKKRWKCGTCRTSTPFLKPPKIIPMEPYSI